LPHSGRPKGSKNKFTNLRNSFLHVYQLLGGDMALRAWAEKNDRNKGYFYQMITKLLPQEHDVSGGMSVTVKKIVSDERAKE